MMKNKIITALLLAAAGFGQGIQAMGGAKDFAKKVFFSKTAAVAGMVMLGAGVNKLAEQHQDNVRYDTFESSLPMYNRMKVHAHFEKLGITNVKMVDRDSGVSLGIYQWLDRSVLFIPRDERLALQGMENDKGLTKEEVLAMMEHEASHSRHRDSLKDCVSEVMIPGVVIMAGKAVRVAGATKKMAVGTAALTWSAALLGEKWRSRQAEKRADLEVRSENAGYFASGLKKILPTVEEQLIKHVNVIFLEQGKPLYADLDPQEKRKIDKWIKLLVFMSVFLAEHPPIEDRIAYSHERAIKFRKEKSKDLMTELRGLAKALISSEDSSFDKYHLKASDMSELKKSMTEDECGEWEKEYGEEMRDLFSKIVHREFCK